MATKQVMNDLPIKNTRQFHHNLTKMANIKKTDNIKCW